MKLHQIVLSFLNIFLDKVKKIKIVKFSKVVTYYETYFQSRKCIVKRIFFRDMMDHSTYFNFPEVKYSNTVKENKGMRSSCSYHHERQQVRDRGHVSHIFKSGENGPPPPPTF